VKKGESVASESVASECVASESYASECVASEVSIFLIEDCEIFWANLLALSYHCPLIVHVEGNEWAMIGQCKQGHFDLQLRCYEFYDKAEYLQHSVIVS